MQSARRLQLSAIIEETHIGVRDREIYSVRAAMRGRERGIRGARCSKRE